jgi:hypothetical protein
MARHHATSIVWIEPEAIPCSTRASCAASPGFSKHAVAAWRISFETSTHT